MVHTGLISMTLNGQNIMNSELGENINAQLGQILNSTNLGGSNNNIENFGNLFNNFGLNLLNSKNKNIKNIVINHYVLVISIIVLIIIFFINNRFIFKEIYQNGIFKTFIKYPMIPIVSFFINLIFTVYKTHKKNISDIKKLFKTKCLNCKNTPSSNKTIWNDISDICGYNLNDTYKDILNNFKNEKINEAFDNPISNLVNSDKTINDINNEIGMDIKVWKVKINNIKKLFASRLKEFNKTKLELLKIKDTITELKKWSNTTEKLFKDNPDKIIENKIDIYIKKSISKTKYPELIQKYKKIYLELTTLLSFLKNNVETEAISKCPICLTNLKDSFIIPCGHCACNDCLNKQYNIDNKIICPICRENGNKIGKLFY